MSLLSLEIRPGNKMTRQRSDASFIRLFFLGSIFRRQSRDTEGRRDKVHDNNGDDDDDDKTQLIAKKSRNEKMLKRSKNVNCVK